MSKTIELDVVGGQSLLEKAFNNGKNLQVFAVDKPALIKRNTERRAQGRKTAEISLDDFEALIAENDQSRVTSQYWKDEHLAANAVIDRLKAESEALLSAAQALRDEWRKDQADAERYRFLRNEVSSRVADFCIVKKYWAGTFPDRILVLDGADVEIDAALGQGEQS